MRKFFAVLLTVAIFLTACASTQPTQVGEISSSESASDSASDSAVSSQADSAADEGSSSVQSSQLSESGAVSPQPAESAAQSGTQAPQAVPLSWWQAGLARDKMVLIIDEMGPSLENRFADFTVYDDKRKLSRAAWNDFSALDEENPDRAYDVSLILNSARESNNIGARILPDNFFELVAVDDTKYTGEFFEKGIKLTRSLPSQDKGDSVLLALNADDYAKLQANVANTLDSDYGYKVAWLSMMRRSRMVSATITSSDGKAINTLDFTKPLTSEDKNYLFQRNFYDDVNPRVREGFKVVAEKSLPNAAVVEIKFNNGLVFKIFYTEKNVLVTASDVEASLLYDYQRESTYTDVINAYAEGNKGLIMPGYKPVIYLYPKTPTDCTVTVDDVKFTYTFPTYDNGWRVTAYPDGRLVNKADGAEHYYLFWEGNMRVVWDFSKGFVVKGAETEQFLREKLAFMGLTPREYNDFITYWVPRVQDAPYNLITFAGERYEAAAPLTVTPKPDSVLRVFMVYKALDAPVEIPEQTLKPFERKGFTVVEWGGTNADLKMAD
ncbi:MAG: hypothetical protein K0S22_442 [Oscillospiraceae bacterium]|nr:hypothetical protein [Oscillospiraceae bacterium]